MKNVLDTQSDAIMIVKQSEQCLDDVEKEAGIGKQETPKFLFCNEKSVQLFGQNLSETDLSEQKTNTSLSVIELPQFFALDKNTSNLYDINSNNETKLLNNLRMKLNS